MLDILQLRVNPDEFEQLRSCQIGQRGDCIAAFTVKASGAIWPVASWDDVPVEQRINVRGWFQLLDQMADEFLLWWPQGGVFFVSRETVTHRLHPRDTNGVLFLQLEMNRLTVVPQPQKDTRRKEPAPRFASQ